MRRVLLALLILTTATGPALAQKVAAKAPPKPVAMASQAPVDTQSH